jgi:UDP-4-amino-4,6-dideoxy-N-acetyl-beta-L-altrosamine N-acetyltransferase
MIKFLNILLSSVEEQKEIREWRNDLEVRKYMYNTEIITEEEHLKWLDSLKTRKDTDVFYVLYEGKKIGIASVNQLDLKNKICEWGLYFNNNIERGKGIGKLVEKEFIKYMFDNYDIDKINCGVLSNNLKVVEMHKKFGWTLEGILRKNILINGERLDIYLLGLLREEWSKKYE